VWLLNLGEIFKGMKHIILLTPDISIDTSADDFGQELNEATQGLNKKSDRTLDIMTKRLDGLEKMVRTTGKGQQTNNMKIKKVLLEIKADQKKLEKKLEEEKGADGEVTASTQWC